MRVEQTKRGVSLSPPPVIALADDHHTNEPPHSQFASFHLKLLLSHPTMSSVRILIALVEIALTHAS